MSDISTENLLLNVLIEHHPDILNNVDSDGNSPLMILINHGDEIEFILKKNVDLEIKNKDGDAALMIALNKRLFNIVKLILDKGNFNPDIQNNNGHNPLMYMCSYKEITENNISILERIVELSQNLDLVDNDGDTALIMAANSNNTLAENLLIAKGSDENIKNKKGQTYKDF